eukprot:CAMPEP_0174890630 /NCGR_PEP_ID=MMETSP0167-20121228/5755_1 /TAXON_ID=38298 /ORGANISM="Rhodella maculata, Strain CCMP736" /LENGTH=196 /DNA_ID=CAMNT_0016128493 /DNA_START=31 /DNA_END=622 /DNA_ORIENTATION=-
MCKCHNPFTRREDGSLQLWGMTGSEWLQVTVVLLLLYGFLTALFSAMLTAAIAFRSSKESTTPRANSSSAAPTPSPTPPTQTATRERRARPIVRRGVVGAGGPRGGAVPRGGEQRRAHRARSTTFEAPNSCFNVGCGPWPSAWGRGGGAILTRVFCPPRGVCSNNRVNAASSLVFAIRVGALLLSLLFCSSPACTL